MITFLLSAALNAQTSHSSVILFLLKWFLKPSLVWTGFKHTMIIYILNNQIQFGGIFQVYLIYLCIFASLHVCKVRKYGLAIMAGNFFGYTSHRTFLQPCIRNIHEEKSNDNLAIFVSTTSGNLQCSFNFNKDCQRIRCVQFYT